MFKTIRSKLIVIMGLILLLTAVVIIYFTHRDVGREMIKVERHNAENILNSVFLNIQEVYRGLISDRVRSIEQAKDRLNRETLIILSSLELFAVEADVSGESKIPSNERFVEWLRQLETGSTNYFLADAEYNVLFDSNRELDDQNLQLIRDIKGEPLSGTINQAGAAFDQYVVFSPAESVQGDNQKLGFLSYFPAWRWVLGAFVDISHIKQAEEVRMEQLIQRLRDQFSQARIAETGSLFIFNQENELIVSPERFAESQDFRSFFPSLAEASQDNELIRSFVDGEKMIFYTRYFRPLGWYLGAMIPEAEIQAPAKSLVRSQSMIIAVIFLLGAIAAIFFVRHISRPLGILAEEAENMARRDLTSDDSHSGQIVELTRRYHDEVGALAGSFMFMQEELRKNVRQLVETTAAKERFQSELNMARDIQMSMVPKNFPPFPEIKEFDLFAMLDPAREVGGDLYDFFMLDEDHLCFTLGDVSDKGMPAALYMAIARTLIQSHAANETSPALIMSRVNDDLSKDNPKSMFVTLIIAVMNIRTGNIRYANAGHNLPVVLAGREKCHYAPGISGPVAGAMEGINYKEITIDLMPGQGLFLYSDGVTEAMNHNQDLFSDERLLCDMIDVQALDVEALIKNIRERVTIFADGAPQSDDITMLMLKYNGNCKTES